MTRNKQQVTTTLLPVAIECFNELQNGGIEILDAEKNSMSGWIETLLADFLNRSMQGKVNAPLLARCKTREQVCQLWLAIRKANTDKGKIEGYEVHAHPKKGSIVAVQGPHPKTGEIVSYPLDLSKD